MRPQLQNGYAYYRGRTVDLHVVEVIGHEFSRIQLPNLYLIPAIQISDESEVYARYVQLCYNSR